MTTDEVKDQSTRPHGPRDGQGKTAKLIDRIFALETVTDIRELRPLLEKNKA